MKTTWKPKKGRIKNAKTSSVRSAVRQPGFEPEPFADLECSMEGKDDNHFTTGVVISARRCRTIIFSRSRSYPPCQARHGAVHGSAYLVSRSHRTSFSRMSIQHFGKGALRVAKNYTKGYSDVQAKVREATSNDPWGPSGTQMNEIAQMSYNQCVYTCIWWQYMC